MHRKLAPLLITSWLLLGLSASASAQSISQKIDVMGWSDSGEEIVTRVTVGASGLDASGNPVNWRYAVVEIISAASGRVLDRFKDSEPTGPPQAAWTDALPRESLKARLAAMRLTPSLTSAVSPDGALVVLSHTNRFPQPSDTMDARCPGCSVCTTTFELHVIDKDAQAAYKLRQQRRTGGPYAPDQGSDDCPLLAAAIHWHPRVRRFAALHTESIPSTGHEFQLLHTYDPAANAASWTHIPLPSPPIRSHRQKLLDDAEALMNLMAQTSDPLDKTILMTRLGDINRRLDQPDNARAYYTSALDLDKANTGAVLGLADLARRRGDARNAAQMLKKAEAMDRRLNMHARDFALYHLGAGDLDKALKILSASDDPSASFSDRLDLGMQILDADLKAGLAFLDPLLDQAPQDDAPDSPEALARANLAVLLIEEAIRVDDLDMALRHLGRLDKKGDDARRLALLIGALRTESPADLDLLIERAGDLLGEQPQQCGVYRVRGLALRRARKLNDALTHLAAAVACNPDDLDAQLDAAEAFLDAGRIRLAQGALERFLELAAPRHGDPTRDRLRAKVSQILQRFAQPSLVLLRATCDKDQDALRCKGTLLNNAGALRGPVAIDLSVFSKGKKPALIDRGEATAATLEPGATAEFNVSVPLQEQPVTLILTAGTNDAERKLNQQTFEP